MRNFFITTLLRTYASRPSLPQIDDSTFSFLRAVSVALREQAPMHNGLKGITNLK